MNNQKYTTYLDSLIAILDKQGTDSSQAKTLKLSINETSSDDDISGELKECGYHALDELAFRINGLKENQEGDEKAVLAVSDELSDLESEYESLQRVIKSFGMEDVTRKIIRSLANELSNHSNRLSEFYKDKDGLKDELSKLCTNVVEKSIKEELELTGYQSFDKGFVDSLAFGHDTVIRKCTNDVLYGTDNGGESLFQKIWTMILDVLYGIAPKPMKSLIVNYQKEQFAIQLKQDTFVKFQEKLHGQIYASIQSSFDELWSKDIKDKEQAIEQKKQMIAKLQNTQETKEAEQATSLASLENTKAEVLNLIKTTFFA